MPIASRFAIATHILSFVGTQPKEDTGSERLAASIGVNSVIVRNIIGMLRKADLLITQQGVNGARLAKPLSQITLLEVYAAVGTQAELFSQHEHPHPHCPVGSKIHDVLQQNFREAQRAMEETLRKRTMRDLISEMGLKEREPES